MKFSAKKVALIGILGALVCAITMWPQIPVPATEGYIHLGDAVIFVAAAILDPLSAVLTAGIGSMMADFFSGYAHWMLPTLIIKGLMALFMASVVRKNANNVNLTVGMIGSGFIMIVGYYVAAAIMKGNWQLPMASVPFNLIQFASGFVVAFVIIAGLKSRGIIKKNL